MYILQIAQVDKLCIAFTSTSSWQENTLTLCRALTVCLAEGLLKQPGSNFHNILVVVVVVVERTD